MPLPSANYQLTHTKFLTTITQAITAITTNHLLIHSSSHHHRLPTQLGIPGLHNCRCGAGNPNWARGGGERVRRWRCGKAREHGLGSWGLWQRRRCWLSGHGEGRWRR
ncbi:hypothetical protein M0R45_000159 [Rubus argutus]|uniref:Uncharacterized protein n=1 Tax=Rubus argutus TaxID=59490 RepID=A0AAW1VQ45_RUBAR